MFSTQNSNLVKQINNQQYSTQILKLYNTAQDWESIQNWTLTSSENAVKNNEKWEKYQYATLGKI